MSANFSSASWTRCTLAAPTPGAMSVAFLTRMSLNSAWSDTRKLVSFSTLVLLRNTIVIRGSVPSPGTWTECSAKGWMNMACPASNGWHKTFTSFPSLVSGSVCCPSPSARWTPMCAPAPSMCSLSTPCIWCSYPPCRQQLMKRAAWSCATVSLASSKRWARILRSLPLYKGNWYITSTIHATEEPKTFAGKSRDRPFASSIVAATASLQSSASKSGGVRDAILVSSSTSEGHESRSA
mmetsp:Transcript_9705/g.20420  ORF Transcript_9705/g.20420 Transcript_9705/m.20420 type:complete len:238 (-) Transcript_9705:2875-3588(-)